MIEVENITFFYRKDHPLFEGFSLSMNIGESWSIIGPSGCGKTTFLYLLAGLIKPIKGQIRIEGKEIRGMRQKTALILQDYGLLPWRTVKENVELGLRIRGLSIDSAPDVWLSRLGIAEVSERYPHEISGGQRQRTAIARAFVLKPDLLLMDEPFSALDAPTRENLQNLILELQKEENLTVILVTHTIEEAAFIGRKILLLLNPPHRKPLIVENFEIPKHRGDPEFVRTCAKIRTLMEGTWNQGM